MKKSELFTQEMLEKFTCQNFSVQFELENPLNGCIMLAHITSRYSHLYFK